MFEIGNNQDNLKALLEVVNADKRALSDKGNGLGKRDVLRVFVVCGVCQRILILFWLMIKFLYVQVCRYIII